MDDAERVRRALPGLPIFPLPGAVLLPHSLVPLHIFEPRYRKMTQDCNRGLKVLALANIGENASATLHGPRVLPVIGVGILARVEPLPDGRFNIVLRGALRARIAQELDSGEPYRVVQAEPLPSDLRPVDAAQAQALQQMILALSRANPSRGMATLAQLVARAVDPGDVADLVAGALLSEPHERQAVLEAARVADRLALASQAAAQALAQSASTTAPN
jgi:hypothetical protein